MMATGWSGVIVMGMVRLIEGNQRDAIEFSRCRYVFSTSGNLHCASRFGETGLRVGGAETAQEIGSHRVILLPVRWRFP